MSNLPTRADLNYLYDAIVRADEIATTIKHMYANALKGDTDNPSIELDHSRMVSTLNSLREAYLTIERITDDTKMYPVDFNNPFGTVANQLAAIR